MDLTPAPSMYFESVDTYVENLNQTHTSRDVSKLRDWMAERSSRLAAFPEDLKRGHGYIDNKDALLPWDLTEPEFR